MPYVRLGDIVVSQPTDTSGGVIQYDLGKVLSGGQFQRWYSSTNTDHQTEPDRVETREQLHRDRCS
jgi:hypothetical protein